MFAHRQDAGRQLAALLQEREVDAALVLALPRGGVPVGYEVAEALGIPLDIFIVRKIGVPSQPELAAGAIASGDVEVFNTPVLRQLRLGVEGLAPTIASERLELARRERDYRAHRPFPDVAGKAILLVDDGLATGASMRAAVLGLRQLGPESIIVAVPVAPRETRAELARVADEVVVLQTPKPFGAVGAYYRDFSQTTDAEVRDLLARGRG